VKSKHRTIKKQNFACEAIGIGCVPPLSCSVYEKPDTGALLMEIQIIYEVMKLQSVKFCV